MLDIAVSYTRYRFLGHEFLTWLWYTVESDQPLLAEITRRQMSLRVGNRIVVENTGEGRREKVVISGEDANLVEGKLALQKGALVTEMHIVCITGEEEWKFNLKGENFHITSLKLPVPRAVLTEDETEGAVLEKVYFLETLFDLFDRLYGGFLKIRLSEKWETVVPEMRRWIETTN